jgi:hypothetical protein
VAEQQTSQDLETREDESNDTRRAQPADTVHNSDEKKPVLRAIPVEPKPEETPVEIRRAVPVGPMDEVDQGALLKAATPSPSGNDQ